jgi:hypothetical protein
LGSIAFAAPDLSASVAPVIWLQSRTRYVLKAISKVPRGPSPACLDVSKLSITSHLHIGPAGLQLLIIHGAVFHVTIQIDGAPIAMSDVDLTFHAHSWGALDRHASAFDALAHLITHRRVMMAHDRPGTTEARWVRNALMAFDGERAGVRQRTIAQAIYGAEAEASTWSDRDGWLRSAVRRDIRRGHRLVETGWRQMLAGGSFNTAA